MTFVGPSVLDAVQHFVERWNEIKKRKVRGRAHLSCLGFYSPPRYSMKVTSKSVHFLGLSKTNRVFSVITNGSPFRTTLMPLPERPLLVSVAFPRHASCLNFRETVRPPTS